MKSKIKRFDQNKKVTFRTVKFQFFDHATWESVLNINSVIDGGEETIEIKDMRKRAIEIVKKHYPEQTMFTVKFGSGSHAPTIFHQLRK